MSEIYWIFSNVEVQTALSVDRSVVVVSIVASEYELFVVVSSSVVVVGA